MMRARVIILVLATGAVACSLLLPIDELTKGDGGGMMTTEGGGSDTSVSDAPPADATGDGSPMDAPMDVALLSCPDAAGPGMVRMQAGLCIDSTEVTRTQYLVFLLANPPTNNQLPECSWNTTYVPNSGMPSATQLPATGVDWCDAYAYCKWAGKELCGTVGDGGPVPSGSYTDPGISMWDRACTKNGTLVYPYGSSYQAGACNSNSPEGGRAPVATFAGCNGGYPGIFDMVGNVGEWENSCMPATDGGPAFDTCQRRGGAYDDMASCVFPEANPRNYGSSGLGFRCCMHD